MSRSALILSLITLQLALPGVAHAASSEPLEPLLALTGKTGGLTADTVAERASATSPSDERARDDVAVARAQLDRARNDFVPRVSLSASYTRLSKVPSTTLGTIVVAPNTETGPLPSNAQLAAVPLTLQSPPENAVSLSTNVNIPFSDYVFRFFQAHAAARAQLAASQYSLVAARRKTDYQARSLYYEWVYAELNQAVARQNLTLSREHLARVQALAAADSAAEADVARVQATVASAELGASESENRVRLARERLRITMHQPSAANFEIGENLRVTPVARPELDDVAELQRSAERNRPELQALDQQAHSYTQQANSARALALPRLDGFAGITHANPNSRYFPQEQKFNSSWQIGVQLSYAAIDTFNGISQIDQAQARAAGARAQRRELLDAIRNDVTEAVIAHRNALTSLDTSARRLTAAETSYRTRRELFLADKATTVELTEAQTELYNARLEAVQAQVAIRLARVRIAYLAGN